MKNRNNEKRRTENKDYGNCAEQIEMICKEKINITKPQ
jgi:hypothetical protein